MSSTLRSRAVAAVAVLAAAGAALVFRALPARAKDEGMSLPAAVLEYAKTTKVGGEFVIEVDGSGNVVTLEAEVAVDALPKAALDLAAKTFPGAKATGAEKEWISGETYWEVVLDDKGSRVELLVKEDGTEGGREEVVKTADVPKVVLDAADKVVPGGKVEVVEKVTGAEAGGRPPEYHVKKNVNGELQRISVTPDGKSPLALRKIKGQFRIPR